MSSKKLNEANVQKKLKEVENTVDSIQTLSLWIIHHKANHEKIVDLWLKSVKEGCLFLTAFRETFNLRYYVSATLSHRMTLFNLCNDVVQNCKRKHAPMYQESFQKVLKDAIACVRYDLKFRNKFLYRNAYFVSCFQRRIGKA